ncbi:hypothetical protein SK128_026562, partial [Halocaridina rubra]
WLYVRDHMTMYHMALPPHMGGPHPPTVHSPLFSAPILPPPMAHNYGMHAFPPTHLPHPSHSSHQPHAAHQAMSSHSVIVSASGTPGPVGTGNSAMLSHPSPMLSQPSPIYPPQTSVYVNPYLSSQLTHGLAHTHSHAHPPHQHPTTMGYGIPPGIAASLPGIMPQQQTSGQGVGNSGGITSGQVMSVNEELMEEMTTLHLGYIETEDSPQKMNQREKLE